MTFGKYQDLRDTASCEWVMYEKEDTRTCVGLTVLWGGTTSNLIEIKSDGAMLNNHSGGVFVVAGAKVVPDLKSFRDRGTAPSGCLICVGTELWLPFHLNNRERYFMNLTTRKVGTPLGQSGWFAEWSLVHTSLDSFVTLTTVRSPMED